MCPLLRLLWAYSIRIGLDEEDYCTEVRGSFFKKLLKTGFCQMYDQSVYMFYLFRRFMIASSIMSDTTQASLEDGRRRVVYHAKSTALPHTARREVLAFKQVARCAGRANILCKKRAVIFLTSHGFARIPIPPNVRRA